MSFLPLLPRRQALKERAVRPHQTQAKPKPKSVHPGVAVEGLREERLERLQTMEDSVERRLAPAMQTCETVAGQLDSVSVVSEQAIYCARESMQILQKRDVHLRAMRDSPTHSANFMQICGPLYLVRSLSSDVICNDVIDKRLRAQP